MSANINIVGQPFDDGVFNPVYNPIVYYLNSTVNTEPNYRYIAEFYNTETSELMFTKKVPPRPTDSYGVIECNRLLSDYITAADPTTTGLTECTSCFVSYEIKAKEEYSKSYTLTSYAQATGAISPYNLNTELTFNEDVPFNANDQIVLSMSDGGNEQPLLQGILTVVLPSDGNTVVVNRKWSLIEPNIPSTGSTISGQTYYADGTRFVSSATTIATGKTAFNGSIDHKDILDYNHNIYTLPTSGLVNNDDGFWLTTMPLNAHSVNRNQSLLINFYTNNASTSQARYLYIAND